MAERELGLFVPMFQRTPLVQGVCGLWFYQRGKKCFDDWLKGIKKAQTLSDESAAQMNSYLDNANSLWSSEHNKRIAECLGRISLQLSNILGNPPEEYRAIAALIERCKKIEVDRFFEQLVTLLGERILSNPSACDRYLGFLLHSGRQSPNNDIALVLELNDGLSAFSFPAAHPKIHHWINQRLLDRKNAPLMDDAAPSGQLDAFGLASVDWENKLAEVNMPVLGGVKLRAMNPESPCQTRYRRIDARSFVVGKEVRKRAKGALEWLTDEERKDKTWGNVSFARDDKEIMLVYPSELPKVPVAAVAMFGCTVMNTSIQAARFVDYAADVTKALRAIHRPLKEVEMRVFALRKMDKARTQVSCDRRYTAERLIAAASEWQTSCGNVPAVQVKQWSKEKGAKSEWHSVGMPFPLEVIWCLNTVWTQAADEPTRVREFTGADGISLLLDEGTQVHSLLERALRAAIRNGGSLLIALAHVQHQNSIYKMNIRYEKQKLLLPAILGLLLAKLGHTKEDYMKSAPYLIGRLLSLADQLHYHYCVHVRNKPDTPPAKLSIPPQLMGNALMPTALEEPIKALALYCNRVLPYQAWAKTTSDEKAVGLARYFLAELGKVCSELGEVCSDMPTTNLPERCTDPDKAQMLIGYLAKTEKLDSTHTT